MQFKSVKRILFPLIKGGIEWQFIDINGKEEKPKFFLSDIQWILFIGCAFINFKLDKGLSKDLIGYIMSAFSISVSLFISLLVSIFDKFENINFSTKNISEDDRVRLIQKKNFFKRFISITSYLIFLSILIILLCSINYLFSIDISIDYKDFVLDVCKIDIGKTIISIIILTYRIILYYLLMNYLLLTLFVTSSSYEYYISEIDRKKIK